jgi:hypothetical protein
MRRVTVVAKPTGMTEKLVEIKTRTDETTCTETLDGLLDQLEVCLAAGRDSLPFQFDPDLIERGLGSVLTALGQTGTHKISECRMWQQASRRVLHESAAR